MASIRRTLDHSEGVELEEISLEHDGEVVDQAYLVRTLRSPEACGDEAIEPGIFLTFEEDVFELCDIRPFLRPPYVQRWRSSTNAMAFQTRSQNGPMSVLERIAGVGTKIAAITFDHRLVLSLREESAHRRGSGEF